MKKIPSNISFVSGAILLLTTSFISIIAFGVIESDFIKKIEALIPNSNYRILIFISIFVLITLISPFLDKKIRRLQKTKNESIREEISKAKQDLLRIYSKRINSKLSNRFPIKIEVAYSRVGSYQKGHLYNRGLKIEDLKSNLHSIFEKNERRLLIVGEPGSGKTTLLLQLSKKILEIEENKIPIIVDTTTWKNSFTSVEEWLKELLPQQMGFSKGMTKELLNRQIILPFFDGLDELEEANRNKCLETIGIFGKKPEGHFIICSRTKEYRKTIDPYVCGQVEVKPLSAQKVMNCLRKSKFPEGNALLDAVNKVPLLLKVIETPFYLNAMQVLFSSMKTWDELNFISRKPDELKNEIIEKFIHSSLSNFNEFSPVNIKRWLAFLANQMNRNQAVSFELINIQYDWINLSKIQSFIAKLVNAIASASFIGMFVGLVIELPLGLQNWMGIGGILIAPDETPPNNAPVFFIDTIIDTLIPVLFIGLFSGLVYWWTNPPLKIKTKRISRLPSYYQKLVLILTITVGLVFSLFSILISKIFITIDWSGADIVFDLLFFSLSLGLFARLYFIYMLEINKSYLIIRNPFQRFYGSMWALHFSIIQHFHLRFLLYQKKLIPIKLVALMREAEKNNLLELPNNGSWRFRHKILQDHFTKYWKQDYAQTYS